MPLAIIEKIVCDWCHREIVGPSPIPLVLTQSDAAESVIFHFHTWDCLRNFAIGVAEDGNPRIFSRELVDAYEA